MAQNQQHLAEIMTTVAVLPCVRDATQEGFLWLPLELERHLQSQGLSCSMCEFGFGALKTNSICPQIPRLYDIMCQILLIILVLKQRVWVCGEKLLYASDFMQL